MPRSLSSESLRIIESLLEREGHTAVLEELQEAKERPETLTQITRALLANEKTFRIVFSHELDPMSLFEPTSGRFVEVNDSWVALYGYSRDEAMTMKVTDVSAEPERTLEAIESSPASRPTRVDIRWHRAKDGSVFPVELTCGKLALGERVLTYAVMRDITQRHRAERALERSEASYRGLIETMPDGVLVHRHGLLVYMSPSARRMLGYGLEEDLVGKPALELVHPEDRPKVIERVMSMMTAGSVAPIAEERLLRTDGTSVVAEICAIHTVFDGEQAVLALARDITLRKEIESQLVMNDRLASLGRLAASVGHELNNPLAYVLGNVALMEKELARADLARPLATRLATHVQIMKEGAERMRDIVYDLKTLARGEGTEGQRTTIDVQHMLDVCVNMAEHELRSRARVVKDYRARAFVKGSEARLGQVFLNLLVNAAQAIPHGDRDANEVQITVRMIDGGNVGIDIADTGEGVPAEYRDRIFEPFFTTKAGAGTGLGLSISHRIVTSAGGAITVEPATERGTVFRVVLPADADAMS